MSEYTLRLLSTRILPASVPTTGAALVAYWQREGVMGPVRISPIAKPMHANPSQGGTTRPELAIMEILDTDILIDVQHQHAPALAWFAGLTTLPVVPGFVVMELIQDAQNIAQVRRR